MTKYILIQGTSLIYTFLLTVFRNYIISHCNTHTHTHTHTNTHAHMRHSHVPWTYWFVKTYLYLSLKSCLPASVHELQPLTTTEESPFVWCYITNLPHWGSGVSMEGERERKERERESEREREREIEREEE